MGDLAHHKRRRRALLDELAAEHVVLDVVVAPLKLPQWDLATPPGAWRIRDQVGHLTFFDDEG
ncbi:MAG: maleylpyruvate isomerase N-terminal domain-containing protein, partial [Acidimicrobiales bacterium]